MRCWRKDFGIKDYLIAKYKILDCFILHEILKIKSKAHENCEHHFKPKYSRNFRNV